MQTSAAPWTRFSWLVIQLARQIRPHEITFSGVNSTLPMLACLLAKRAYDFPFTYLNVAGGVDPQPAEIPHSSSAPALFEGSASIFANQDFYDLCLRGGMDLCFLGAAQIDALGRTNVSVIGDFRKPKVRLPGGGGAVVMMPTARRVVTWRTEHTPRVLVDRLDFITAAGHTSAVITPLAVFERDPADAASRLQLTLFSPDTTIEAIRAQTGFEFEADAARIAPPPTARECAALTALDPDGRFAGEL
jgi:glutaconate CoA-transferase, subunit B